MSKLPNSITRSSCKILILCLFAIPIRAQNLNAKKIEKLTSKAFPESVYMFREFLSIPNDVNKITQLRRNLEWCRDTYEKLGFEIVELQSNGFPVLLASKVANSTKQTVFFYCQIDGQPADEMLWDQKSPYDPVLKEEVNGKWATIPWLEDGLEDDMRIYARSASDSKGPASMLISALKIMKASKIQESFNVKVLMDFQEEKGSPDLPALVESNRELMRADYLVIMDGARSVINEPTLTYGARGIATMTLRIYGPKENAHSGQFGNYVPNPVFTASRLIASMKDENGKVLIPGFYEGVTLTDEEKLLLNKVSEDQDELLKSLGIAKPESVGDTYQESLQYPSLNIRGMQAAWTGQEARTIIPSEVTIEIDMRLVPETPGERQVNLVKNFISTQGFHIVVGEPTDEDRSRYNKLISIDYRLGSLPFRTELTSEMGVWLTKAVERATGKTPLQMRTTGGSQPISPFITTLGIPAIAVRIPNPGSNIHGPNENIRLGNFKEGIATCLAILTQPFK